MVNIVMLAHARPKLLAQSIESLYATTAESKFTLTLVLDAGDPLTERYVRRIDRPNSTVMAVERSRHVLSQLKNLGVYWTEQQYSPLVNDWLYLSDDDVWFGPGWLDRLTGVAEVTERYRYKLWGGQAHPYHQPLVGGGVPQMDELEVLDGPSWLMRWDTWRRFGPLDRNTAPGVCQSEEYPFCARLRATRHRIGVIRPRVVVHTGLTNSEGKPAPGANDRRPLIPAGVYTE